MCVLCIFETRNFNYNLMSQTDFVKTRVNTTSFGLNSLKFLAAKIWDIVPCDIKSTGNLKDVIASYADNMFTA